MATNTGSKQYLEVDLQAEAAYGPHASQNPGFAAGETTFGEENSSPVWRGVPIVEDGFGINPVGTRSGEVLKRNIESQAPGQLTGFDVGGALNPLACPHDKRTAYARGVFNWIMGAALSRSSNVLRSYSMRWVDPSISMQKILGAKCNQLTIEGSQDSGVIAFTSEWVAASHAAAADPGGTIAFPKKNPKTSAVTTEPDALGWAYARAYLLKGVGTTTPSIVAGLRSFSLQIANNLTPASPRVKTTLSAGVVTDTYVITEIREGEAAVSGNFVIDYVNRDMWDSLASDDELTLYVLARHAQSNALGVTDIQQSASTVTAPWDLQDGDTTITVDAGSGAVGNGQLFTADNDYGLFAGGVVLLEDQNSGTVETHPRDVGLIKTGYVNSSGDVVLDDGLDHWTPVGIALDDTFANFVLYDTAFGISVTGVKLDQAPQTGGPADVIGQDVQFTAGQTGSETATVKWIGASSANATS